MRRYDDDPLEDPDAYEVEDAVCVKCGDPLDLCDIMDGAVLCPRCIERIREREDE